MAKLSPYPVWQIFDGNGKTIPGALLYTYAAGTTEPKATYTDHTGHVQNPNPIVADTDARMCLWLGSGNYKFVLTDGENATLYDPDTVEGNIIWTKDYINGSMGGAGDTLSVRTIAELRALQSYEADWIVNVQGYLAQDDGGGGWFWFKGDSTADDNSGTIIIPDDTPTTGRWYRFDLGAIDVKAFAVGIGGNNDIQLQKCLDYASTNGCDVHFSHGDYTINESMEIKAPIRITGEKATIHRYTNTNTAVFVADGITKVEIEGLSFEQCKICSLSECSDIKIKGLNLQGGYYNGGGGAYDAITYTAIGLYGCKNAIITDNKIANCDEHVRIDSIDSTNNTTFCENIQVVDNIFYNDIQGHRSDFTKGISVLRATNVQIADNTIRDIISGTNAQNSSRTGYSIYEQNGYVTSLTISNNTIINTTVSEYWTGIFAQTSEDIIISDNMIKFTGTPTILIKGIAATIAGKRSSITGNILIGCSLYYAPANDEGRILINGNMIQGPYVYGISAYCAQQNTGTSVDITSNTISDCGGAGILVTNVFQPTICNNEILDCNKANTTATETRSGIVFVGCYKGTVSNNTIQNTTKAVHGHMKYGIDFQYNGSNSKWLYEDNTFGLMETGNYNVGYTSFPTGYWWEPGDKVLNTTINDQVPAHFECIAKGDQGTVLQYQGMANYDYVYCDYDSDIGIPIQPGDVVGIAQDNNTIFWTRCNGIFDGSQAETPYYTVYLQSALESVASIGNIIYWSRWRNIEPESAEFFIKGVCLDGDTREVRVNGRRTITNGYTSSQTYGLMVNCFNKTTMEHVGQQGFDLASVSGAGDSMATYIGTLGSNIIATITSQGTFNTGISANLKAAAASLGLYKLFSLQTSVSTPYSYAALFTGAYDATLKTNSNAIEVLQAGSVGCPRALITASVYQGGYIGNSSASTFLAYPGLAPSLLVNSSGYITPTHRYMPSAAAIPQVVETANIDMPANSNIVRITRAGVGGIHRISNVGWAEGSVIYLVVDDDVVVNFSNVTAASGNYMPITRYVNNWTDDNGVITYGEVLTLMLCTIKSYGTPVEKQRWMLISPTNVT